MKKIAFLIGIIAAMAFGAQRSNGQVRYNMGKLNNDTLSYILLNYRFGGQTYTPFNGCPMNFFIDESELEFKEFVISVSRQGEGGFNPNEGKIRGMWFNFYLKVPRADETAECSIGISFMQPYLKTEEEFDAISDPDYTEPWSENYYEFFKDYRIDKIWVLVREQK